MADLERSVATHGWRDLRVGSRTESASAALERQNLHVARVETAQACVGRARAACAEAAHLGMAAARARRQVARRRAAVTRDRLQGSGDPRLEPTYRKAALALHEKGLELDQVRSDARDGAWTLDDRVVQVLYGVGMTLQAALAGAEQPALRDQLERAIRDIDELVGVLRRDMGQLRRGESRSALT